MKVTYSEQPPLSVRLVCALVLLSPDDVLARYNRLTDTVWVRSTLSPEMREYALQHEIGHSRHPDWKSLCLYMSVSTLPFIVAWGVLRLMGLVLWGTLVLLFGILSTPIRWRYIRPRFMDKSEELAHNYARNHVRMTSSIDNQTPTAGSPSGQRDER